MSSRAVVVIAAALFASGCSPLAGSWSGTCEANGAWSLDLQGLTSFNGDVDGAEEPNEWESLRGTASVSPTLGSMNEGEVTLYHCSELQAPCTYDNGATIEEVDDNYVRGEISVDGEPAMRFHGWFLDEDSEIDGSCYNLVSGGSGSLRLNH